MGYSAVSPTFPLPLVTEIVTHKALGYAFAVVSTRVALGLATSVLDAFIDKPARERR